MQLGRVVGTVVATTRTDGLDGVKFLIVQPLDKHRRDRGSPVVAADAVAMAGPGELVYYVASREAAEALEERFVPVDHAIVDEVRGLASEHSAALGHPRQLTRFLCGLTSPKLTTEKLTRHPRFGSLSGAGYAEVLEAVEGAA